MPQLMPIFWKISMFVLLLLCCVLVNIYYYLNNNKMMEYNNYMFMDINNNYKW